MPQLPEGVRLCSNAGRCVDIALDGPCVCGSARTFRKCCRTAVGITVRTPATVPLPPVTGHRVEGCYASALGDCGGPLTKEHYFSKALLRAFTRAEGSPTVRLLRPGRPDRNVHPEKALHEPILCKRHNSALSPLDTTAERLFEGVREGVKLVPRFPCRAVNGSAFERWMLKAACGFLVAERGAAPLEWLRTLFGETEIDPPCGLYMHLDITRPLHGEVGKLQFGLFRDRAGVSGAVATFDAVTFTLDLRGNGRTVRPSEVGSLRMLRPLGIWFDRGGFTRFYLAFDWGASKSAEDSVVFNVLDVASRGPASKRPPWKPKV
jgi:hypothetical protein